MDLFVVDMRVEPRESAQIPAEATNVRLQVWLYAKSQMHARNSAVAYVAKYGFHFRELFRTTMMDLDQLHRLTEAGSLDGLALAARLLSQELPIAVCLWESGTTGRMSRDMLSYIATQ